MALIIHTHLAQRLKKISIYISAPSVPSWCVRARTVPFSSLPKTSAAAHASSYSVGTGTEADCWPLAVLRLRLHGAIPPLPSCDFIACTGIPILHPNSFYIIHDFLQDGSGYLYAVYYSLLSFNFSISKAWSLKNKEFSKISKQPQNPRILLALS